MGKVAIEGITHWAIPVNDMEESVKFYGDILGLENRGQLGQVQHDLLRIWRHQHPPVRAKDAR